MISNDLSNLAHERMIQSANRSHMDPAFVAAEAPRLLVAGTTSEFFEKLFEIDEVALDVTADPVQHGLARAALLYAPAMYPEDPTRVMAGAAYSFSLDAIEKQLGADTKQSPFIESVLPLLPQHVPGFTADMIPPNFTLQSPGIYMYDQYIHVAELMHQGGGHVLTELHDQFGIRRPTRLPVETLIAQIQAEPGPEASFFIDDDECMLSTVIHSSVIEAGKKGPTEVKTVFREFISAEPEAIVETLLQPGDPVVGIIQAHGHRQDAGPITSLMIEEDISDTEKAALREKWRNSGGVVLLSCYGADTIEEVCIAGSMAEMLEKPVIGSEGLVLHTSVTRRTGRPSSQDGPPVDRWKFNFHADPGTPKMTNMFVPDNPQKSDRPIEINYRTVYTPPRIT